VELETTVLVFLEVIAKNLKQNVKIVKKNGKDANAHQVWSYKFKTDGNTNVFWKNVQKEHGDLKAPNVQVAINALMNVKNAQT